MIDITAAVASLAPPPPPLPKPLFAFSQIIEKNDDGTVRKREYLCAACVLDGFIDPAQPLYPVDDADDLADERGYFRCDSCVEALHPRDTDYDQRKIGLPL